MRSLYGALSAGQRQRPLPFLTSEVGAVALDLPCRRHPDWPGVTEVASVLLGESTAGTSLLGL